MNKLMFKGLCALLGLWPQLKADPLSRVVGIVDRLAISHDDVMERLKLMLMSSGQSLTPPVITQLYLPALQGLIDEALQKKAAEKAGVKVNSEEIESRVKEIEAQNGLKPGEIKTLFRSHGISPKALEKQTSAMIMWMRYIDQKYGRRASVSPKEVEKMRKKWIEERSQPLYHIAEIVLYPSATMSPEKVQQQAQELYRMIEEGAPFVQLAHQFSQSSSRERGGNMGWRGLKRLEPYLHEWVKTVPIGSIGGPWALPQGRPQKWVIVALLGRKSPGELQAEVPTSEELAVALRGEILSLWARKELEHLRRNAHYEIRLPKEIGRSPSPKNSPQS